ncbi:MAG: HAMP domain-containing histidine kinase [Arcobacter sp.]|nr:HAMP domain-containing histidine kinase [Arcobacter sp.]
MAIFLHITQSYFVEKTDYMNQIDLILTKSVQVAPLTLPTNFHHKNMLTQGLSSKLDMENIKRLSAYAKILGVKYIYTMVQVDNKIIFTSSSATEKELSSNTNLSHFGDTYNDASPVISTVFKTKQKAFDEYADKWGSFHTLYIPLKSEDGTSYVVGADIDISHIDEQLNRNLLYSIADMLFYIIILLPFFLVYRTNMSGIKKELEETIEKRTNELYRQEKQMFQQAKMASMGEMISNIAHQWRQPLSVISTCASGLVMYQDMGIATPEATKTNADMILKNAEYLSVTIDNFRNFFIPDKPKEAQHIAEVFDIIDSMYSNLLAMLNIKFIKNIEDFTINTHINELRQVIINIIKNAKDAIDENGYIFVGCSVSDKIYIRIKDSGGGIPDDIMEKIYEPYFTTKHQSVGTGIGLNMSYQIVTEHLGGDIKAQNITYEYDGKILTGAEFTISLPKDLLILE